MEVFGREYNPDQWRLFTDSSKVSLKLVLLHNVDPPRFFDSCSQHEGKI